MEPIVDEYFNQISAGRPNLRHPSMSQQTLIDYGKTAPVLHSFGGVEVVRLSHNLVLKSGTGVLASEGDTMRYVTTTFPGVRLPRVYRYFNVDYSFSYFGVKGYIGMDYVDGLSLSGCWDQLSPELQKNIVARVAAMVNQLQSIRLDSPDVIGGGISRGIWFSDYGAGPFATKEGFEKWLNWILGLSKYYKRAAADIPHIEYQYFVLVHGDLSPRNLVLDTYNQVWLVDWGCAGVYPPIFETASMKHQIQFPSFAQLLLPLIFNNADEMVQLESCSYGIKQVAFSLPP